MKPAKIFPAILCILALLACCFSATADGVSVRSVKPGEKVNGVIETATEAVFRVTFPSEGTAQLKAGGKALRAVVQKEAGRERIISGTADDSGTLQLSWNAEKADYLIALSMPEGEAGEYTLTILFEEKIAKEPEKSGNAETPEKQPAMPEIPAEPPVEEAEDVGNDTNTTAPEVLAEPVAPAAEPAAEETADADEDTDAAAPEVPAEPATAEEGEPQPENPEEPGGEGNAPETLNDSTEGEEEGETSGTNPEEAPGSDPEEEKEPVVPGNDETDEQADSGESAPETPGDKPEEEPSDEAAGGVEYVIARTLEIGEKWSGTLKRSKPTILRIRAGGRIHLLVEGKNIWTSVQQADLQSADAPKELTDPETNRVIISWDANAESYLVTLGTNEGSLLAKAEVTVMGQSAFEAWEAEHSAAANEEAGETEEPAGSEETGENPEPAEGEAPGTDGEPSEEGNPEETPENTETGESGEGGEPGEGEEPIEGEEPEEGKMPAETGEGAEDAEGGEPGEEGEPTEEQPGEEEPEVRRSITVNVTWDTPHPIIGDTAHFSAVLEGYEGLPITMQWQYSPDRNNWIDMKGETRETMDVVVTKENNLVYWRIVVYVEGETEE